jgi:hypothetical protein
MAHSVDATPKGNGEFFENLTRYASLQVCEPLRFQA